MKFIKYWLPPVVWMGLIFVLSSRPSVRVAHDYIMNFLFFKLLHVIEYYILYILVTRSFLHELGHVRDKSAYIAAFLFTVAFGISDELHQTYIPTREGKIRDVIIDALGASLAWISILFVYPIAPPKLRKLVLRLGLHT